MNTASLSRVDLHTASQFLTMEAKLLDDRRFNEWIDLFTDDGIYWVPLRPEQQSPDEASLFYDTKDFMRTRFERLAHPRIHSQIPYHRTCRIVGSVMGPDAVGDDEICVKSTLMMADYRQGVQRLFAGHVEHRLRVDKNELKISMKRVNLINCDDAFELIAVPF